MKPLRWGDWNVFLRHPLASLVVCGWLCLPLLLGLLRFTVGAGTEALLSGDQRNLASYAQVRDILGENDAVVVSLGLTNLFTPLGLETVRRVSEAFERLPQTLEVKSLTHAVRPVRRGLSFEMVPLVPEAPLGAPGFAELREFCLSHPLARNLLVAEDGVHTLITVQFADRALDAEAQAQFQAEVDAVLAPLRAAGVPIRVLALPLIEREIRSSLRRDLAVFVPSAMAVVVGVLWLTFRSWGLVGFTLLAQSGVLALLPGLVQVTGFELTVFSVILLPLITGIHLTLLIHLLTAVQRATVAGKEIHDALGEALSVVGKPALASTLTTVLGLLSLGTSPLETVRAFGQLGAICLVAVHAITFGPVVAMLTLWGSHLFRGHALTNPGRARSPRRAEPGGQRSARPTWLRFMESDPAAVRPYPRSLLAARLVNGIRRRRALVLGAAVLTCLLAIGGMARLRTDVRVLEMLNRRSPTRQALEEIDRAYGGFNVVQIAIDSGRANGVQDISFLRYLDKVQRFAEGLPEPSGVFSYAQLLAIINQVWEGGRADALRLPENPWLIALFTTALRSYELPFLTTLADADYREAQLVIRTRDMPAREYLALIDRIATFAETHRPEGVRVSAARGINSILEADRRILRSQFASGGSALLVIGVVLVVLWRSLRLGVIGVVTSSVPVALALAVAGYLQVPLNSINVLVGALALGIAQDDTIHFITHWREQVRAGRPTNEALQDTLEVKGRPIIWTTVILVGVFGLFGLSSFPPVVQFGLLLSGAFVLAQGSLLVVLPAWLMGSRGGREVAAKPDGMAGERP